MVGSGCKAGTTLLAGGTGSTAATGLFECAKIAHPPKNVKTLPVAISARRLF